MPPTSSGTNQVRPSRQGPQGAPGPPGKSAYESYVECMMQMGETPLSECEWALGMAPEPPPPPMPPCQTAPPVGLVSTWG